MFHRRRSLCLLEPNLECFSHEVCRGLILSVIIITGGRDGNAASSSAEVWKPDVFPSPWSLPELPEGRDHHTQTGLTACGGGRSDATLRSCVTLSENGWIKSNNLIQPRSVHCAWDTGSGIILLGGVGSPNTTELLKEDGGSEELFHLKYPSR